MVDRDNFITDNKILLKQRNIYCNSAKRLYRKLPELHHSCEISREQHRKLLSYLAFEREKVDETSYDCEMNSLDFDKVPDNRYTYGIVKIDDFLDANELVDIVNETLTKNEQIKILKRTKNLTSDSQTNFADIEDDYDNISEIEEEEVVDCSQLSVIN